MNILTQNKKEGGGGGGGGEGMRQKKIPNFNSSNFIKRGNNFVTLNFFYLFLKDFIDFQFFTFSSKEFI